MHTIHQVTFQARDIDESRYMYDQLAVLGPIMLALTAGTPILKVHRALHTSVDILLTYKDCPSLKKRSLNGATTLPY